MFLHGRKKILSDVSEITSDNIIEVLTTVIGDHENNAREIDYLWDYYRGKQPIESRKKDVRPEINNKVVVNRANEIVTFKTGYLLGEPIQYVSRGEDESIINAVTDLNTFVFAEEKLCKDKELGDWMHIAGTGYRIVLPDGGAEEDESPFELETLDPRSTFVVYENGVGQKPLMGVTYSTDRQGVRNYYCSTPKEIIKVSSNDIVSPETKIVNTEPNPLGLINIVEYPLNEARLGAFEIVIGILDAINNTTSNQVDNVEQIIQALLLFHNVDISSSDYDALREKGAIKFKDIDQQLRAEIKYLINELPQGETNSFKQELYEEVLTICGMPNRNGGSSTSDTGSAVIMRDGWSAAEARAKDTEMMFKRSEKSVIKLIIKICKTLGLIGDLKVSDVEIRFTRRNYENAYQKAQTLDLMLKNPMIHPKFGFAYCGMFPDPDQAYTESMSYYEEHKEEVKQEMIQNGSNDSDSEGSNPENGENPSEGE